MWSTLMLWWRFLKLQLLAPFLPTSSSAAFSFTRFFRCSRLKKTNKKVWKVPDLDKEITTKHSTQAEILNCGAAARTAKCAWRRSACKQQMELRPCIVRRTDIKKFIRNLIHDAYLKDALCLSVDPSTEASSEAVSVEAWLSSNS